MRSNVGSEPATTRKATNAAIITTLLAIGAAAAIENRRRAYSTAVAIVAARVEQDLRQEPPQEERLELALIGRDRVVLDARGQHARDQRGGDDTDDGQRAEPRERDAEQSGRQPVGLTVVAAVEELHERRHEHGRQRAGGHELEQHVRHRVGRLERVAEVCRAEHRGDDEDAHQTEPPRERGDRTHARRGPLPGHARAHRTAAGMIWSAPRPYP